MIFKQFKKIAAFGILGISIICILGLLILELNLPDVELLRNVQLQVPLRVYTLDHKLIAEYGEKRRTPVSLEEVPKDLINAILATEDRRFYQHPGVDIRGLLRAVVTLITTGNKEQGGSTITMQVARNFFLSRKKTYTRKINEILLALKIERQLSKDEILELYFNKIYLGKRAYGVQAASKVYYGTTVDKLTLAQMAMIAGLPQAPSAVNPLNNPEASIKRRRHVLDRMLHYGFITQEQYDDTVKQPLTAKYHGKNIEIKAPYIAEMARQELVNFYGNSVYSMGLDVYLTIDSKHQKLANNSLIKGVLDYDQRHGYRGPVAHFELNEKISAIEELRNWQLKLYEYQRVANLRPAVVTATDNQMFWAMLKDGSIITVDWDNMSWARKAIRENRLGPKPTNADEIVKVGDVIYLQKIKNSNSSNKTTESKESSSKSNNIAWRLAQIPTVEGALVAIHPDTGKIKALVGGFDFRQSRFNRAIQAERQPGSSFKPFVYSTALENGFTTASIINDAPIVQEEQGETDWRPQNHTKKFYGPTRLREGLIKSRNLVSIRLLQSLGITNAIENLREFGFSDETLPSGLSLALGSGTITPLELASAYCAFPNGGYRIKPILIEKIVNYNDEVIFESNPPELESLPKAISEQTAYIMSTLLKDAIRKGTGSMASLAKRKDYAGKTGTTNEQIDNWYAGYNRELVTTVWLGFDEPKSLHEYAIKSTFPIWADFMNNALTGKEHNFPKEPGDLITVKIDPKTGLLARKEQKDGIYEIFKSNDVPVKTAPEISVKNDTISEDGSVDYHSLF